MLLSCPKFFPASGFSLPSRRGGGGESKSLAMLPRVTCDISLSVIFIAYHDSHNSPFNHGNLSILRFPVYISFSLSLTSLWLGLSQSIFMAISFFSGLSSDVIREEPSFPTHAATPALPIFCFLVVFSSQHLSLYIKLPCY